MRRSITSRICSAALAHVAIVNQGKGSHLARSMASRAVRNTSGAMSRLKVTLPAGGAAAGFSGGEEGSPARPTATPIPTPSPTRRETGVAIAAASDRLAGEPVAVE